MNNIAIIPARSGSKGLENKNIKILVNKPLLAYSIFAAKESGIFSEVMVSTDSIEYAKIAKKYGANVPFLRSKELSNDSAGSWDVVKEVLYGYYEKDIAFDTVCLLQPTSPLRKSDDIIAGYDNLYLRNADAITAVCEMEHSPLWSFSLENDNSMIEFRKHVISEPRQNLKTFYRINGALFIRKIEYKNKRIKILDKKEYAFIMERDRSVDIDNIDDFEYASYLINSHI